MKSKFYIIDVFFIALFLMLPSWVPRIYASPDDATWQKGFDTNAVWQWAETGSVWSFLRFYPYGDEEFTMKMWRKDNATDLSALKFDSGMMYWWWKTNSTWIAIGTYPTDQCWLETCIDHTRRETFYLRNAVTDVIIWDQEDLETICNDAYEELYWLCFDQSDPDELDDEFEFQVKFYGGSVAFDYSDVGSCQDLFFWPLHRWVIEEYENDDFSNWDSSSVTCNSSYVTTGDMTIGKFWITGSEPSTPDAEDVDSPWWEQIHAQMWDYLQRAWTDIRETFTSIPVVGDFLVQLWSFFDWAFQMIGSAWNIVTSNLPAILILVAIGYFMAILTAIPRGNITGIKDAFMSPINDARAFGSFIVGIVTAIWNFFKFW